MVQKHLSRWFQLAKIPAIALEAAIVLAATAASIPAGAAAEDVEFKYGGEYRLRYEILNHDTAVKKTKDSWADFSHRVRLELNARKGETLQVGMSLLHNATWGDQRGNSGRQIPDGTSHGQNLLTVNRAWGWWKATNLLSFKFGRLGLEVADGAVFSENDWLPTPTSHEGVMATWDTEMAKVSLIGLKAEEFDGHGQDTSINNDPEVNIYSVNLDFKSLSQLIKIANIHFIQERGDEGKTYYKNPLAVASAAEAEEGRIVSGRNVQRLGGTLGGDAMGVLYKATVAAAIGEEKMSSGSQENLTSQTRAVSSYMADALLGYSAPSFYGFKLTFGYHWDTGDKEKSTNTDENYLPLYYDRHNYAGLMDVLEWGNLTYFNVNLAMIPLENLEFGIGYYVFNRTSESSAVRFGSAFNQSNYSTVQMGAAEGGSTQKSDVGLSSMQLAEGQKSMGSELDVYANKIYEGGFQIGARYGLFFPGQAMKLAEPARDQKIQQFLLQAGMRF